MSAVDGKHVVYGDDRRWAGTVLGDAWGEMVNVQWVRPEQFVGVHRVTDLVVE